MKEEPMQDKKPGELAVTMQVTFVLKNEDDVIERLMASARERDIEVHGGYQPTYTVEEAVGVLFVACENPLSIDGVLWGWYPELTWSRGWVEADEEVVS